MENGINVGKAMQSSEDRSSLGCCGGRDINFLPIKLA
jgi:hypothetical protein